MDGMGTKDAGTNGQTLAIGGWLRPMMWPLLVMVGAIFLLAACGGGNGTTDDSNMVATNAQGTPMRPGDVVQSSDGDRARDFELVVFGTENYTKDERINLSKYLGQPVVVNFWFPSCPPCRAEMPDLEQTFQNHKADGVIFIGVQLLGLDNAADGQAFVDEVGVTYALGPDEGDITRGYKITSFPTTFFLDRDHKVVKKWSGILTGKKMEELVQEALQP